MKSKRELKTKEFVKVWCKGYTVSQTKVQRKKSQNSRLPDWCCMELFISRNRSLIVSPTASGKSLIIYSLVRYYQMDWTQDIDSCPYHLTLEQNVYRLWRLWLEDSHIGKKFIKDIQLKLKKMLWYLCGNLSTKMPKKYFEQFDCVIGDGGTYVQSKIFTSIMTKLHQCKYRFGFTGTLDGTETHKLVLEGLFAVEQVVTTKELIDKKTLVNLKLNVLP